MGTQSTRPTATHERRNIGRNRKVVTVVRFGDGDEVVFTERFGKQAAIAQAIDLRARSSRKGK